MTLHTLTAMNKVSSRKKPGQHQPSPSIRTKGTKIQVTAPFGDLTVAQLRLLRARLNRTHRVQLQAVDGIMQDMVGDGHYWLGDDEVAVLVRPTHTVAQVCQSAARVRATIDADGTEETCPCCGEIVLLGEQVASKN